MSFPRSQLDDRRRRVLTEEVIGPAQPADDAAGTASQSKPSDRRRSSVRVRPYGDAALMDRQPRITDLVPQRYSMLALLFLAGVTIVAGLEALYAWLPELASKTAEGTIDAIDLAAEGSLGAWFSSTALALASVAAVVVYSIRRHKADDYHGRYRIWLWAAACWMLLSMDEGGSLHEGFTELMSYLAQQRGFGDGSIWWISAYSLLLGTVGMRLTLEMRECRSSTAALLATAACYAAAVLARLNVLSPGAHMQRVMVEEGCEMVGNLFLLFAMTLHARYTILAAQGRLPAKKEKPAKPKAEQPAKAEKLVKIEKKIEPAAKPAAAAAAPGRSWFRKTKIDPAHNGPPAPKHAPAKSSPPARRAEVDDEADYDDDPPARSARSARPGARDESDVDEADRRVSKAERKAMRREKNRSRRDED
ncbi:MAG TPA: hypothetical protein VGN42_15330 [Pirellulales bacterium]|jgi:hypothetical protein|nr:hypothetical protein [Pirellulales bacterium]